MASNGVTPDGLDEDAVYDAYVEAALAGETPDPVEFCRSRGCESEALLGRLQALGSLLRADEQVASPGADGDVPFDTLGEYRLLRRLGTGGMGVVFLAEQTSLKRLVALKIVRPEWVHSPTVLERFRREAEALARLQHPGIVTILGVGEDKGVRFTVMELVPGRGLDELLEAAQKRGEPMPVREVVAWIATAAEALEHAHRADILHRDVKPSNVRITPDGDPVLVDFGMVRDLAAQRTTLTDRFTGSPSYAPPEQISPGEARMDGRSDIYALGITLYECLAGRVPFEGRSMEQLFRRVLVEEPRSLRHWNPAVPRDLDLVVAKAVEKDPDRRYASAADFARDLRNVLELRAVEARPPSSARRARAWLRRHRGVSTAVVAAVLVGVGAIAAFVLRARADENRREGEARVLTSQADELLTTFEGAEDPRGDDAAIESELWTRFLTEEERAEWSRTWLERSRSSQEREELFEAALNALDRAEALAPDLSEIGALRARAYVARLRGARARGDEVAAEGFLRLVRRHDVTGAYLGPLESAVEVSLDTAPAGAEVFLFRYVSRSTLTDEDDPRLVPVPFSAEHGDDAWGDRVQRVTRDVGSVRAESVVRDPGTDLPTRWTVAPLEAGPSSRAGTTPISLRLEPGSYVALLIADGHETLRAPFEARPGEDVSLERTLLELGTTPGGFVRVTDDATLGFWIQDRELTCAEYAEFLTDPLGLELLEETQRLTRNPRTEPFLRWMTVEDGLTELPAGRAPDEPATHVSAYEADSYVRWRSEMEGWEKRGFTAGLPTEEEWVLAFTGGLPRKFPFGNEMRPWYLTCRYSSPIGAIEPVLTHPEDESPFGVFDLAGSVGEWCSDVYTPPPTTSGTWITEERTVMGGSWLQPSIAGFPPEVFLSTRPRGYGAIGPMADAGLRIVLRPVVDDR